MPNNQNLTLREEAEGRSQTYKKKQLHDLEKLSTQQIQKIVHELEVHQIELEMQNEELNRIHHELNITKNRYFDLYDMAPIGYCTLDENGLIQEANLSLANLLGVNRGQLMNQPITKFIYRDDQDVYYHLHKKLRDTEKKQECELRIQNTKQITLWAHLIITAQEDKGDTQIFRLMLNDITKRRESDEKISIAATVFTHTSESILIANANGTIYDVNDAFIRTTGYTREDVIGKNPNILSSGQYDSSFYRTMWESINTIGSWAGEIFNKRKNGEIYPENLNINVIYNLDGSVQHYIGLFSDMTPFKNHMKELEHIAHYDSLTELPNRALFSDRLHIAMAQAVRRKELVAVVFLDLDGFKEINDTYGHDAGDQLLISLSFHMQKALREVDTLARIGGDEFAAILVGLPDIKASLPIISRLLDAASQKIDINGQLVHISASLGITLYPQSDATDADHLLRQADQSMYEAKIAGKNRYHFFNTEQNELIKERYELIEEIQNALILDQFVLYYQPKVNMRTGKVIGAEALIRWEHPKKGLVPPLEFLPAIEGHTLSVALGEWVIHTALTQIERWQNKDIFIAVSVNIGARQLLENNFVDRLETILLEHSNVKSSMLEIEVLETSRIEDVAAASVVINRCKDLGVLFSLDDFGTGYSSLTYLKQLPVSHIKIDQSFVKDMLSNVDDLAILDGVIKLSDAFRRHVIAEGVETLEQGKVLLQLGCELAQGYVVSPPMPAVQFPLWLQKWSPDSSWLDQPLIDSNQLQILFAGIEHQSWVADTVNYIKQTTQQSIPLRSHDCHFAEWLEKEGSGYFDNSVMYDKVKCLHQDTHTITYKIIKLHTQHHTDEAFKLLDTLYQLRDDLLKILNNYVFIPKYQRDFGNTFFERQVKRG
jgi:diguanylate cyclase (GGDEF)-like protein/PAS domain S-box-containing protein